MQSTRPSHPPGFLSVDRFLVSEIGTLALASAFELGLIDLLATGDGLEEGELPRRMGMSPLGWALVADALVAAGVLARSGDRMDLTPAFRASLCYRDLMEAKTRFFRLVAADFASRFTQFLVDLPAFMAKSAVFELFRYDRCLEETAANLDATRRWVDYTTLLTRYEADVCLDRVDIASRRRMLDVGGNSGEFALRACRRHGQLTATVFDLPVVCALGREHLASEPEAARIRFVAGDMRSDPLPSGHDLLTFKSVLHDWPEPDMRNILGRAARRLEPGSTLLIFERGPLAWCGLPMPASMFLNLVFAPFYRPPAIYADILARLGFEAIATERIELDTPFHLLTARKPA